MKIFNFSQFQTVLLCILQFHIVEHSLASWILCTCIHAHILNVCNHEDSWNVIIYLCSSLEQNVKGPFTHWKKPLPNAEWTFERVLAIPWLASIIVCILGVKVLVGEWIFLLGIYSRFLRTFSHSSLVLSSRGVRAPAMERKTSVLLLICPIHRVATSFTILLAVYLHKESK